MEGFLISPKGFEDAGIDEIKRIIRKDSKKIFDSCIIFEADEEKICELTYKSQSAKKVGRFLKHEKITKQLGSIKKVVIDWPDILLDETLPFRVECDRNGEHDFNSAEVELEIGKNVLHHFEKSQKKPVVDLKNPKMIIYCLIEGDEMLIGFDYAGIDLSKRDYKIFQTQASLNGAVAYALVHMSGYEKAKTLLVPSSNDGTIPIEAALYGMGKSPNYYRKKNLAFPYFVKKDFDESFKKWDDFNEEQLTIFGYDQVQSHTKSADKNSKIIGVHKQIKISKVDMDWFELKFDKNSVDCIISSLPVESKNFSEDKARKVAKELFYQAEHILKKNGKIILFEQKEGVFEEEGEKQKIYLKQKKEAYMGKQKYYVLEFQKEIKKINK